MNDKTLSLISLSRKAGKLLSGFDVVKESIRSGEAKIIMTAGDLSAKTKSEIEYVLRTEGNVTHLDLPHTMDELWPVLGRRAGVLAVTDAGFAKALIKLQNKEAGLNL